MYESKNSVYCYKGTNVLVNKMNIKDPIALKNYETSVIGLKLMALSKQGITGKFDVSHFVSIHKFLFEDIYPFAGLFRTENIAKDYFQFAEWEYIESELTRLLSELKSENFLANLTKEKFAERLAYYWAELNVLHPFREGNGRTTREFLRHCRVFVIKQNRLRFETIITYIICGKLGYHGSHGSKGKGEESAVR